jgi:DNA-binding NtrC family response regulator
LAYILILDDDAAIRELLEILLTEEGYEVESAQDNSHALAAIKEREPALILFDMRSPGAGGHAFVEAYRELPDASAILIAVSGIADLEQEAARIGADGFLPKPFDIEDVLAMVRKALS